MVSGVAITDRFFFEVLMVSGVAITDPGKKPHDPNGGIGAHRGSTLQKLTTFRSIPKHFLVGRTTQHNLELMLTNVDC